MQDPEQTPKSKRWIIMIAVVVIAFILYYIASYAIGIKSTEKEERRDPPPSSSMSQTNEETQSKATQPQGNSVVDTNLLTAPVPQDGTAAQEEISSLQDQQAQLADRKASLQDQLQDSDKLVELKEKYLADLQAQVDKTAA